jgi:hypothetical protein
MSHRERQTSDGANGPIAVPPAQPPAPLAEPVPSAWEALFFSSPAQRREELLSRARSHGVVYAHQFPAPPRGAEANRSIPAAALVNGRARELIPNRPAAICPGDTALDDEQRDAVARALHTPDVCVIAGVAGSGKSRVAAEIIRTAAARGERVLLLSPTTAALDRVLGSLRQRDGHWPLRCPAVDEAPESLPAETRDLTLATRVRQFRDETVPAARAALTAARDRLRDQRRESEILERLVEIADRRTQVVDRLAALDKQKSELAEDVAASARNGSYSASPFGPELAAAVRARDEAIATVDAREAAVRAEQEKLRAALNVVATDEAKLRVLAEARRGWRVWSAWWWRALRRGDLGEQLEHLGSVRAELETNLAGRDREAAALAIERETACETFQAAVDRYVRAEVDRRSSAVAHQRADEVARLAELDAERDALLPSLDPACQASLATKVGQSHCSAERAERLRRAEEAVTAAERWVAATEEALPNVETHLAAAADIVAATTATINGDPHFGDRTRIFDLLVLEEADRVTEAEFSRASRRARRWVLIGDAGDDRAARPTGRVAGPAGLRPGFFQRLWDNLHADPTQLPYRWRRLQDGRLSCRLRALPDDRSRIEVECVADRPDIELRIRTPDRGAPELFEVVFPGSMSVGEAKRYLFCELDELAVQPAGRGMRWSEEAERIVLWLGQSAIDGLEVAEIADGVLEQFAPAGGQTNGKAVSWHTHAISFERSAAWSRERAEEWICRHSGLRDLGRTAYLGTPRRMRPALAGFVTRLLSADNQSIVSRSELTASNTGPAVEFIPVPPLPVQHNGRRRAESDGSRRSGGVATPTLKGARGAGLETELSEARRPDLLPADVRRALPAGGLVNYLEACAVVKELEALVTDSDFRREAVDWLNSAGPSTPALAVIALYPAQADLIRHLVARVPALANCSVAFEIGTPDRFRQRECLAALVSLTRSHAQRPVSLGEGPQALALALTRACGRLLLFGDPGMLARRGQCAETVDHLDPAGSARERAMAAHLVTCIQGHGEADAAFRLRQENGS